MPLFCEPHPKNFSRLFNHRESITYVKNATGLHNALAISAYCSPAFKFVTFFRRNFQNAIKRQDSDFFTYLLCSISNIQYQLQFSHLTRPLNRFICGALSRVFLENF